jgi:2,4-dienoyl-CoA reductase-like NADH-dependent reductase (Old Yellow Enzyme family)
MTDATSSPLFQPLSLAHGPDWPHRIALAPLTNQQSHADGTLSDDEFTWLTRRATGGFALVMTCAAHVQAVGQGFSGQLGCFGDQHLPGLTRLAGAIRAAGAVSSVQLHHAGMRSPADLIGTQPVSASDAEGARGLTTDEVIQLRDDFIAAAVRAQAAGFDGVEVHGAHGYILTQFLSADTNRRADGWGGDYRGRTRLVREILAGIRTACGAAFQIGLRLSPERFGIDFGEARQLAGEVMGEGLVDYLDMSLWNWRKPPQDPAFAGRTLLEWFTEIPRGTARLGLAGQVRSGADAYACIAAGADFVMAGRAAILHHDLPRRIRANPDFEPRPLPVPTATLAEEGLGPTFIHYMRNWQGFVADG